MKRPHVEAQSFPVIRITPTAHAMIQGVEAASMRMEEAQTHEEINVAYRVMGEMRDRLYEYVSLLELVVRNAHPGAALEEQSVHVRFK